jgi:hypothetical protein
VRFGVGKRDIEKYICGEEQEAQEILEGNLGVVILVPKDTHVRARMMVAYSYTELWMAKRHDRMVCRQQAWSLEVPARTINVR